MDLKEARSHVRASIRVHQVDDDDLDRGIMSALDYLNRADLLRTTTAVTATANNAELDISSITGIRPGRIWRVSVGYDDQGTWATATSYTQNDLVQGDGDPDSLYYVARSDHTSSGSNEPGSSGGSAVWERVYWTGGTPVKRTDFAAVASALNNCGGTGRPTKYAVKDSTTLLLYPVPDLAYPINVTARSGGYSGWVPGTKENIDISYDDELLRPVLWWAAPAFIEYHDTALRQRSQGWRRFLDAIEMAENESGFDTGVIEKSFNDFT